MVAIGAFGAVAAPIQEIFWYSKDYWHPHELGLELLFADFIFGFSALGIAAVLYEIILNKAGQETEEKRPYLFFFLVLAGILGMGILQPFMNSIYAAIISIFCGWLIVLYFRKDLLVPSLLSGVSFTFLMFMLHKVFLHFWPELVTEWWKLQNLSVLIAGIPLEEYLWFFSAALVAGSSYKLWKGVRFS